MKKSHKPLHILQQKGLHFKIVHLLDGVKKNLQILCILNVLVNPTSVYVGFTRKKLKAIHTTLLSQNYKNNIYMPSYSREIRSDIMKK